MWDHASKMLGAAVHPRTISLVPPDRRLADKPELLNRDRSSTSNAPRLESIRKRRRNKITSTSIAAANSSAVLAPSPSASVTPRPAIALTVADRRHAPP